jgi:ectoine hydroxylase-related dioxygenase (phytanoyl-CoA dioxygenase family)
MTAAPVADDNVFAADFDDRSDPIAPVRALGLLERIAELDAHGFTIIRPDEFNGADLSRRLRDAILIRSERINGRRPDLKSGSTHVNATMAIGEARFSALLDDPVFEEALMHPVTQAIIGYLLGESCKLSSFSTAIRGPGTPELGLHTDMILVPSPFPAFAQVANVFWILTDVAPEDGSTFFWPGSHKFCRRPTREECSDTSHRVAVTAPAGSLLVWHGNTWHGAGRKQTAGLRVTMPMHFCRSYFVPQEDYRQTISPEALARNDDRFATLLGVGHPYPFAGQQPDFAALAAMNARTANVFG